MLFLFKQIINIMWLAQLILETGEQTKLFSIWARGSCVIATNVSVIFSNWAATSCPIILSSELGMCICAGVIDFHAVIK
jgi:hypothetical protein